MFRPLLAALMSAALALSVATGPAGAHETGFDHRHDRSGDARAAIAVLGGLAALYLIKERSDRKEEEKREKAAEKEARKDRDDRLRGHERPGHRGRGPGWGDDDRRLRWDDAYDRVLPDDCYRSWSTREGLVSGYGARCLQQSVPDPAMLPPDCISQIRTDGGIRNLYADRCLRRAGWTSRTARR